MRTTIHLLYQPNCGLELTINVLFQQRQQVKNMKLFVDLPNMMVVHITNNKIDCFNNFQSVPSEELEFTAHETYSGLILRTLSSK